MNPMTQRMVTIAAGMLGGWLVHHLGPYGLGQETADLFATAVTSWAFGWATKHFADWRNPPAPAQVPPVAPNRPVS